MILGFRTFQDRGTEILIGYQDYFPGKAEESEETCCLHLRDSFIMPTRNF